MKTFKPNFFILGGPKCGTTALSRYLDQHPEVLFSYPKEPNFFNTDFAKEYRKSADTFEDYLEQHFLSDLEDPKAVGTGTVWNLYSREAIQNILDELPDSLFIVMLRNPIDLAYALHSTELFCRHETVEDFEVAWDLQEERKKGESIPKSCTEVKTLLYGDAAKQGEQLQRLLQNVHQDKVLIIFFEDFVERTEEVYNQVCEFLSISEFHEIDFKKINSNRKVKNKLIMDMLHTIGRNVDITNIKKRLGIANRGGIINWLKRLNSKSSKRKPLSDSFRVKLEQYFKDDIKKLEQITGRDLTHWHGNSLP